LFARTIEALSIDRRAGLRGWDFFMDQHRRDLRYAGKTYEVAWWKKGSRAMTGDELRDHSKLGYQCHSALLV
jgi:hypothetical protein